MGLLSLQSLKHNVVFNNREKNGAKILSTNFDEIWLMRCLAHFTTYQAWYYQKGKQNFVK